MRRTRLPGCLLGLAVLASCFQPVPDHYWGLDQSAPPLSPGSAAPPDSGVIPQDAGEPELDAGAPFDSGTPADAGGAALVDAGNPNPNWNVGCDAGSSPPGPYCAPCTGPCDCAMGPGGSPGVCLNTPTGQFCTWACGPLHPVSCAGQARCLQIYPSDDGWLCVPSQANGGCE